jgi:hypothetical protein
LKEGCYKKYTKEFVYQFASLDYYELVGHWEVDENTNVDVFEEIEENYPHHLSM